MSSSNAFLTCRIDWRPSPALCAALAVLGVLAGLALMASAAPRGLAWPGALLAAAYGGWLARSEWRRPAVCIGLAPGEGRLLVTLDDLPAERLRVNLRGVVAVMTLQCCGRRHVLTWCPFTLTPDVRRTFRLLKRPGGVSPTALPMLAG